MEKTEHENLNKKFSVTLKSIPIQLFNNNHLTSALESPIVYTPKSPFPYERLWPAALCCSCEFTESESLSSKFQTARDRGLGFSAVFSFITVIADVFTKGLHSPMFLKHCRHLSLVVPDQSQIPG